MTIENINAILGTNFTLVKRNGTINEGNVKIMKKLASITEAEVREFMRTDAGWNMTPAEKHARGYHALRALAKWYKEHGNGAESGNGEGNGANYGDADENGNGNGNGGDGNADAGNESDGNGSAESDGNESDGEGNESDENGDGEGEGEGNGNGNESDTPDAPKPSVKLTDAEKQVLAMITRPQPNGRPNNVYLHGPAGTGKSYMVKRIAEAIGAGYWETGIVAMKEELLGFKDASGEYSATECINILKHGKEDKAITIMNFDEFDGMPNGVTLAWNNIFASRRFTTPEGTFEVHPSVRFVATGNTTMDGSDENYDRETVDKSVKTRWLFKEVGYDKKVEKKLADADVVEFLQGLRRAKDNCGLDLMVTYREFTALQWSKDVINEGIMSFADALDSCVFKGLSNDDKDTLRADRMIQKLIDNGNTWARSF